MDGAKKTEQEKNVGAESEGKETPVSPFSILQLFSLRFILRHYPLSEPYLEQAGAISNTAIHKQTKSCTDSTSRSKPSRR